MTKTDSIDNLRDDVHDNDPIAPDLIVKQVKALIGLITREQTLLTGYGDPGRYDLSDLAFFNALEADLIRSLTKKHLSDKQQEFNKDV